MRRVRLGDVSMIEVGMPFSSTEFTQRTLDVRLLRGDNVSQGRLNWAGVVRWPRDSVVDVKYAMKVGDVVVAMDRPWVAAGLKRSRVRAADVPSYLVQRVARLRAVAGLDQDFLGYLVESEAFSTYLQSVQTGTAIPHISGAQISGFEFDLPPTGEQRAIAEVLGALDDKIAANRAIADHAEDVLRAEVDAVWLSGTDRSTALTDYVELNPRVAVPREDRALYIDMKRLPESGWTIDGYDYREPKSGARFSNGDTLLARITPCLENRKTAFVDHLRDDEIAIGSTEFIVMRSRPGVASPISFLLATESRFRDYAVQHMVGTTGRQRVAASDLALFAMPAPDNEWLRDFGERASQIFTAVRSTAEENRTLAATRDALLPQLMSGKLRVRDAEKIASEAGA